MCLKSLITKIEENVFFFFFYEELTCVNMPICSKVEFLVKKKNPRHNYLRQNRGIYYIFFSSFFQYQILYPSVWRNKFSPLQFIYIILFYTLISYRIRACYVRRILIGYKFPTVLAGCKLYFTVAGLLPVNVETIVAHRYGKKRERKKNVFFSMTDGTLNNNNNVE